MKKSQATLKLTGVPNFNVYNLRGENRFQNGAGNNAKIPSGSLIFFDNQEFSLRVNTQSGNKKEALFFNKSAFTRLIGKFDKTFYNVRDLNVKLPTGNLVPVRRVVFTFNVKKHNKVGPARKNRWVGFFSERADLPT